MLLAQAFAEYLGFVECVSAAKPQCRMGRAKRNALWSYTVSDQARWMALRTRRRSHSAPIRRIGKM